MGSVLLKLELITWNFCLLFLLPSWVWLLPSLDMAIMDMDMAMVMDMDMDMVTMDTMARGLLRPSLDMVIMVMAMVLDMVMDMAMDTMATDMVVMDTTDIMAGGLLMLSQAMDIM